MCASTKRTNCLSCRRQWGLHCWSSHRGGRILRPLRGQQSLEPFDAAKARLEIDALEPLLFGGWVADGGRLVPGRALLRSTALTFAIEHIAATTVDRGLLTDASQTGLTPQGRNAQPSPAPGNCSGWSHHLFPHPGRGTTGTWEAPCQSRLCIPEHAPRPTQHPFWSDQTQELHAADSQQLSLHACEETADLLCSKLRHCTPRMTLANLLVSHCGACPELDCLREQHGCAAASATNSFLIPLLPLRARLALHTTDMGVRGPLSQYQPRQDSHTNRAKKLCERAFFTTTHSHDTGQGTGAHCHWR